MIRVDCIQGSPEWMHAKLGVVSASSFDRIITKTGKLSSQSDAYCYELIAEVVLGRQIDDKSTGFIERGTQLETEARQWYEVQRDVDVEQVGFITRDDGKVGCSPDGLVGNSGGLEIKCPAASTHVGNLLGDAGEKYRCQIQGSLLITERDYWDFVSYNPGMPSTIVRFGRDETFIKLMRPAIDQFVSFVEESKEKLIRAGVFTKEHLTKKPFVAEPVRQMKHRLDEDMWQHRTQCDDVISIDTAFKGPSEEALHAGEARNEQRAKEVGL